MLAASTTLALLAFAANSVLSRLALQDGQIDPNSFTLLRLLSGALMLSLLLRFRRHRPAAGTLGRWPAALALWVYAAGFSLAYRALGTATGALLLFGAVQLSMLAWAVTVTGERLGRRRGVGLLLALGGVVGLLLPQASPPPLGAAVLMLLAGLAWAGYSLLGRHAEDAVAASAGNFWRACAPAALCALLGADAWALQPQAITLALICGAVTSGLGYALWYHALPQLQTSTAAGLQLSVPLLAAVGGVIWVGETPGLPLLGAGTAILAGIGLLLFAPRIEIETTPPK